MANKRWHIERDYQQLKYEIGLNHYEGRNWRGFHPGGAPHHARTDGYDLLSGALYNGSAVSAT